MYACGTATKISAVVHHHLDFAVQTQLVAVNCIHLAHHLQHLIAMCFQVVVDEIVPPLN